jgi:hypothetical protein
MSIVLKTNSDIITSIYGIPVPKHLPKLAKFLYQQHILTETLQPPPISIPLIDIAVVAAGAAGAVDVGMLIVMPDISIV